MQVTRRGFLKICAAGMGSSTLVALGFSPTDLQASVRAFKLARTIETRTICPYCSVSCGVIMYSLGSGGKNAEPALIHIEGDPDNPISRGTLCPKGAGLVDLIKSPDRALFPEVREPGTNEWKRLSWEDAITRIARLMKEDRDQNFVTVNDKGQLVNRWNTTGLVAASTANNESLYLTSKWLRSLGMVTADTQARI